MCFLVKSLIIMILYQKNISLRGDIETFRCPIYPDDKHINPHKKIVAPRNFSTEGRKISGAPGVLKLFFWRAKPKAWFAWRPGYFSASFLAKKFRKLLNFLGLLLSVFPLKTVNNQSPPSQPPLRAAPRQHHRAFA